MRHWKTLIIMVHCCLLAATLVLLVRLIQNPGALTERVSVYLVIILAFPLNVAVYYILLRQKRGDQR